MAGEPIVVTKKEKPTRQDVEELLAKLEAEIKALFDKHKHAYGWHDVQLIIK